METNLHNLVLYLFEEFKKSGIQYCILRNYEELPDDLGSHDIDMLVERKQMETVHNIMRKYEQEFENVRWIRIGERQYVRSYYLSYEENGQKDLLQFDYFYALDWHGRTILGADYMLSHRTQYKGYSILRPAHEALNSLFSSLIRGGFYKRKYHAQIKDFIKADYDEFEKVLKYSVGKAAAKYLIQAIQEDDFKKCERLVPYLRKNIMHNSISHNAGKTLLEYISFVCWEMRNRIFYAGALFAVVGGKREEREQFACRLMTLIYKYYKNEGVPKEHIIYPGQIISEINHPLRQEYAYWKYYIRRIHKLLNKTYGIIMCGYPAEGRCFGKKADLLISLEKETYGGAVFLDAACSDNVLEQMLIEHIVANDNSGYKNFVQ